MAKKNFTSEEREEYRRQRESKTAELEQKLKQGIKDVYQSEKYKAYLEFCGKFHSYSFKNCFLIMLQKPTASLVAGFVSWKKLGRYVGKGERAIQILRPIIKKEEAEKGKEPETVVVGYAPCSVFDVSQTFGAPLPQICALLDGESEKREKIIAALEKCTGIPVEYRKNFGNAKGFYSHSENCIVVREEMSDLQTVKTAVHESAHSLFDNKRSDFFIAEGDRSDVEIRAESVAYIVCGTFGLDTSEYSFEYVASWAKGKTDKQITKQLEDTRKVANIFIDAINKELGIVSVFEQEDELEGLAVDKALKKSEAIGKIEPERLAVINRGINNNDETLKCENEAEIIYADALFDEKQGNLYRKQRTAELLEKPRIFIDMDGTLSRFHDEVKYLERMFEKGFFRNLKPFEELVNGVKSFIAAHPEVEIYILSAAVDGEPPYCRAEKNAWIDEYLPEIDKEHRILTKVGADKTTFIPNGVNKNDILIDDYNKNLDEWQQAGGQAIKCKNNINHKGLVGELWGGKIIDNHQNPEVICKELETYTHCAEVLQDFWQDSDEYFRKAEEIAQYIPDSPYIEVIKSEVYDAEMYSASFGVSKEAFDKEYERLEETVFKEQEQDGIIVWKQDGDLSCGINADGQLFVGDNKSGDTLIDNPANRKKVLEVFKDEQQLRAEEKKPKKTKPFTL